MALLRTPLWHRGIGAAVCILGLFLCALCCGRKEEAPMVRPDEFQVLRIYDLDASRNPIPEESRLVGIAHVDVDKTLTQRVFKDLRYSEGPPFIVKGPRYLGLASTAEGEEYRLEITWPMGFFVIKGQPGCYHFEGDSLKEISTILRNALEEVFIPARMRTLTGNSESNSG